VTWNAQQAALARREDDGFQGLRCLRHAPPEVLAQHVVQRANTEVGVFHAREQLQGQVGALQDHRLGIDEP
jgi:hypothetical protein